KLAVSAGSDHTVPVWDLALGEPVRTLPGHTPWVNPVALTPDNKTAGSPRRDHPLRTWGAATGQWLHALGGHEDWCNAVALTSDAKTAVSAGSDNNLLVWDVPAGRHLRTLASEPNPDPAAPPARVPQRPAHHLREGHTDWVHHVATVPQTQLA